MDAFKLTVMQLLKSSCGSVTDKHLVLCAMNTCVVRLHVKLAIPT